MSSYHGFAHRPNLESFDSICRTCFATVASHVQERNLTQFEPHHHRDPIILEISNWMNPYSLVERTS